MEIYSGEGRGEGEGEGRESAHFEYLMFDIAAKEANSSV